MNANGQETTSESFIGNLNPFRYRGYYYDTDTGFYYLNSRYYDPQVKRFINADDISYLGANGDMQGFNLYAYCSNNPVMYADPSGNLPSWAIKLIVAASIVVAVAAIAAITVATAGTGTAIAAVAVGAAKGAAIGFASGAAMGAAGGAISHRVSTGTWEGAGEAALNGMADGALSGAITGAITGGITGGLNYASATSSNTFQPDPRITKALKTLDETGIRPGQTQVSQSGILAKYNSYDYLTATSSYTKINGTLHVSEGHHTMIANVMKYGKLNTGPNMGLYVNDPNVVTNILWSTLKIVP